MNKAKWLIALMTTTMFFQNATAQDEEMKGFDPNRVFVGGSLGLGMGFGSTTSNFFIGLYPQIGYSVTDWLDAGIVINGSYNNQKVDYGYAELKINSFTYGTGALVRTFLFRGLFAQVQPEINWMTYKETWSDRPGEFKDNAHAGSLLVGGGFGSRAIGRSGFYTTIMFDVLNEPNSPYRINNSVYPIIQAGFVVYLGQKKQDKYMQANPGM